MLPWQPPASMAGSDTFGAQSHQNPSHRSNTTYLQDQGSSGIAPYQSPMQHQQQTPSSQPSQSQQQQQQHQPPQQQQQSSSSGQPLQPQATVAPAPPPPPPPITLASTLHFLQTEHRRYARDRNEWEIERAEMRARIALLEGEKRGNEGALRDLGRRCKMLEVALRGERSKFLSNTNSLNAGQSPSPSGTSSPVRIPSNLPPSTTHPTGIPPSKIASIKEGSPPASDTASPPNATAAAPPITISGPSAMGSRSASANGYSTVEGVKLGGLGIGGRDPRGKARSRDYLKQCLQEITYLTSTTTLNPLSPTFFVAPNLPRPRKVLPDHIPTAGGNVGGLVDLNGPSRPESAPPVATTSTLPTAPSLSNYPLSLPAAVTNYPSDPASTFIPLKRQASQQGRAIGKSNDVYSRSEWKRETTPIAPTSVPPLLLPSNATPHSPSMSSDRISFPSTNSLLASTSIAPPSPLPSLPIPDPFTPVTNHGILCEDLIETTPIIEHSPNPSEVEARRGSFSERGVSSVDEEDEEELNRRRPAKGNDNAESRLTAISKPESKESWSEQLKEAGKTTQTSEDTSGSSTLPAEKEIIPTAKRVEGKAGVGDERDGQATVDLEDDDALSSLMWEDAPEEEDGLPGKKGGEVKEKELWKTKKTMRSHLSAVRAVAFGGLPGDEVLVSGGDDMTIRVWKMDASVLGYSRGQASTSVAEPEPYATLRSHKDSITSLLISSDKIYSASLDGTIKIWRLPPTNLDPYSPFDREHGLPIQTLTGHGEAVWGIAKLTVEKGARELLGSVGADGSIRIWELSDEIWSEVRSFKDSATHEGEKMLARMRGDPGVAPIPTCIVDGGSGAGKGMIFVGFSNSILGAYEISTGLRLFKFDSDTLSGKVLLSVRSTRRKDFTSDATPLSIDGTLATQINSIARHPTLDIIASAHQNNTINVFDIATHHPINFKIAHVDGINAIEFMPSIPSNESGGKQTEKPRLVSVSNDLSLLLWDVDTMDLTDVMQGHQMKSTKEGIMDVAVARGGRIMATAGADGTVKIWCR